MIRFIRHAAAAATVAMLLGGCGETNPVRDAAQGVGLASRPSEPADFVRASRPAEPVGFVPIGRTPPPRPEPRKPPEAFRALEADLDAQRQRLEAEGAAARAAGATPAAQRPPVPRN
jgi:hypothetical protein